MTETEIMHSILARIGSRPDVRLWRNNTGVGRSFSGNTIAFGLKGSADLIGLVSPSGRFLAIEVKRPGCWQSSHQKNFEAMVRKQGGIYIVAHSADEAEQELAREVSDCDGRIQAGAGQ